MTFNEFKASITGKNNKRPWKVTNSHGIYDAYKLIRKSKWKDIGTSLTEHQFYTIVTTISQYLANQLGQGNNVKIPYLGSIEIRKYSSYVKLKEGKLKTNYPIDWSATIKLWYEDQESYKNKTLVRMESKELFTIYWNKSHLKFTNKQYFQFRPSRGIKKNLSNNIKLGRVDAFQAYNYKKP